MADTSQLEAALVNADRAGDTTAAQALAAEIVRVRGAQPAARAAAPAAAQPTLSRMQKIGQGMMDPINGGAQLLTHMLPEGVVNAGNNLNNWLADKTGMVGRLPAGGVDQQVRESEAKYEGQRAAQGESGLDGYRMLGNVASPANLALGAALPRAATAGGRIALGALGGAGAGALSPVVNGGDFGSEKLGQIGVGAAVGGALPVATGLASRVGKVLRAGLIDPFTDAGRTKIVGNTLNRAAANKAEAAANMSMVTGATPNFLPTAGQASNDAGIASLERAARAIDPAGFGDIDSTQRAALVGALRNIAGTPETRSAAVRAREDAVKPLYNAAKNASIPVDAELGALMNRPSMKAALSDAALLAEERGGKMMQPEGPPSLTGESLHDIKLSLDTLFKDPTKGIVGAKRDAANETRTQFLAALENRIPEYGQARNTFTTMSGPINQQDIGQELYNRFVPALADGSGAPFSSRAASFAQALRNGDELASNVTGMAGAKLKKIMSPDQMGALTGVRDDAQMIAAAQSAGRGVGSDTVQKMAMSNMIDQAGLPSWIGALKPLGSVAGMARTVGDIVYTKNDETMRHLLADVLKDPARASAAMKQAGIAPSKFAEYLNRADYFGTPSAASAVVAGQKEN